MSIIEAGARGGAVTLLLLLTLLLLRDARGVAAARFGALFTLGAAALLVSLATPLALDRALWLLPLRVLAFGNPAVFLVMASALFDDDFALASIHGAVWCGLVALGLWAVYVTHQAFPWYNAAAASCVMLTLWRVLAGRADDLVEDRRRLRLVFVVTVALFTAAISLLAIPLRGGQGHPIYAYIDAFGSWLLGFTFSVLFLSLTPGALFRRLTLAAAAAPAPPRAPGPAIGAPEDPRERALLAALRRELDDRRAYREEKLGITALAGRLGVPEYRLRRLINQRLGHRNFAAFLNGCRLDEVTAALDDRSQDEVPILTIALDAGFQSIGTFNRAFKARTGLTPTEYRGRRSVEPS